MDDEMKKKNAEETTWKVVHSAVAPGKMEMS